MRFVVQVGFRVFKNTKWSIRKLVKAFLRPFIRLPHGRPEALVKQSDDTKTSHSRLTYNDVNTSLTCWAHQLGQVQPVD